jgi:hypothetical protein
MPFRPTALAIACFGSTTLALLLPAAPAPAQERKGMLPTDGEVAFKREYERQRQRFNSINKANEGEKANKDSKEDQTAIDVNAQWYTYRLTWDTAPAAGHVNTLMEEFFGQVNNADSPATRKNNPAFSEMYIKALAQRARDVVQTRNPLAAVNAARMLARLAKAGSEEAADACLEAVKDSNGFLEPKARLGAQYWALQGLGNALTRLAETPAAAEGAAPGANASRKTRELNYVQALIQMIERKQPTGPAPPGPEEIRGLQMFRREAVRALVQYRSPAILDDKGGIKLPTALTLLKVVNDDGMSPSARLDEQTEAAIGIATLPSKALPAYQPDYAAQQIGYLVVEFARTAEEQKLPKFPLEYYAARLGDALEAMRADVKGSPDKTVTAYIDNMVDRSLRVLKSLESTRKADSSNLKYWLDNNAPPHKALYAGMSTATVRTLIKGDEPEKPAEGDKKPGDKKPDEKKPDDKKPDDKKPTDKKDDKKPDDKPKKP